MALALAAAMTTKSPPSPPLLLLLVVFTILASPSIQSTTSSSVSSLSRRSSLSVDDTLVSPDGSFTFGFHQVGTNAYALSIWFSSSTNRTVAWTANRDRPVNARASALTFRKDGAVDLTDFDGTVVWKTNTTSTAAQALRLLNTGNLVVTGPDDGILWQSFDYPTDTLLPTQPITKNIKLVSSIAPGSLSSGYYSFYFDNDNVMRLIYDGPEISSIYWPNPDHDVWGNGRTTYNSSRYGVLDHLGMFAASDQFAFNASDAGPGIKRRRRLSIDYDGNLRLYSLSESEGTWAVSWVAIPNGCLVHGLCGKNGVCGYATTKRACSCLPGFRMTDPSDWSKGCKREIDIKCNDDAVAAAQQIMFVEIPRMDFWGYDLNHSVPVSYKFCEDLCRHRCSCEAFQYKTGSGECYTKSVLFNGRSSPDSPGSIYLKLPKTATVSKLSFSQAIAPICNESSSGGGGVSAASTDAAPVESSGGGKRKWAYLYGFVSAFGAIEAVFIALGWFFVFRKENKPASLLEQGYKMISSQFRKYTYRELSKATNKFKDELGRGASGAVYKGILDDERAVAVKKMEDAIQGGEEFWAEVSVIGRIYHMNLVRMWGFCSEGSHKLLVYEYVERGSLEKLLFDSTGTGGEESSSQYQSLGIGWRERFKIALGVARGLAYLHHECLEWVIHCDVKPENILLDKDFEPKIADFGLAKLLMRGGAGSELSKIRGTRGYMAPEWVSNLPITAKVDVYSYGVVVLEMVKGCRISTWMASGGVNVDTELVSLLKMLKTKPESRDDSWVMDFVDSRLEGKFNTKQVAVMLRVAISCLEEEMNKRPTMDDVLHRLLSCED